MRAIARFLGSERGFVCMMGVVVGAMIAVGRHLITSANAAGIPEGVDAAMWCDARAGEFAIILMAILIGGVILAGLTTLMLSEGETE